MNPAIEHRIRTEAKAFTIQKLTGHDKDGEPIWTTLEYYRKRSDLIAALKRLGLPESLADDTPRFHGDAIEGLIHATTPVAPRGRHSGKRRAP